MPELTDLNVRNAERNHRTKKFKNMLKQKSAVRLHPEYHLQCQISQYLTLQYPDVEFMSDTVAFLGLTAPQKARNKKIQKSNFRCPDLLILEPSKGYAGLFIELKVESPFTKNGDLKKQKVNVYKTIAGRRVVVDSYNHLEEQQKTIDRLNAKGYKALFSWGFDMTKKIIDDYLDSKKTK